MIAGAGLASTAMLVRSWKRSRRPEQTIHELARALTTCRGMAEILDVIDHSFASALGLPFALFCPEGDGLCLRHHSAGFNPQDCDFAHASRCISSGVRVVSYSDASDSCSCFLPLTTWKGTLGALSFRASGTPERIPPRTWTLLESFAGQTSLAILSITLEDKVCHPEVLSEADNLQKALLNSIAHNVRTPLSSIIGVLSTLKEEEISSNLPVRRELIDTARQEAERLNRLLGNLLDLSRLEAKALRIRKDPCDVQDVIGAALEQLGTQVENRSIEVILAKDLCFVPMDFVLIVQVLVNILDNAVKYSPPETAITLEAGVLRGCLEIRVSDLGTGIKDGDLRRVFEKFNRGGRNGETGGLGLGLSICEGLIEAHDGEIWAERRHPQGTRITFTLPL